MGRIKEWKGEILKHKNLILLSILFLIVSILLNYAAGEYIEKKSGSVVPDLILDNLPILNLSFIFYYGMILIISIFLIYPLFFNVKKLHIAISQFSLLVMIRSFFVTLTHLAPPYNAVITNPSSIWNFFDFQNALFFSGHTAIPFLGFLIFKESKIKYFFLVSTFVMAITVLFMHVHYSIDVFAALFIAYGSYNIGNYIFKRMNHH
jgi:hypothetical protein